MAGCWLFIVGTVVALLGLPFVLNDAPYRVPAPRPYGVLLNTSELVFRNEYLRDHVSFAAQGQVPGQETVVLAPNGKAYLFDHFGFLHALNRDDGSPSHRLWHVGGRVLGAEMHLNDTIIACDASKGLIELTLSTRHQRVLSTSADDTGPLFYCNDVVVSPRDGRVYFTDAASIPPWRKVAPLATGPGGGAELDRGWATYEASLLAAFSAIPSGRLLCFDPATQTTTTLASNLFFANGVALAPDEQSVIVAETFALRLRRVWIAGPRQGQIEDFAQMHMPPDGVSSASSGGYWVALPTSVSPLFALASRLPLVRFFLGNLPSRFWPKPDSIGAVARVDESGRVVEVLYDTLGSRVSFITAVSEVGCRLYLGQLRGDSVPSVPVPGCSWSPPGSIEAGSAAAGGGEGAAGDGEAAAGGGVGSSGEKAGTSSAAEL